MWLENRIKDFILIKLGRTDTDDTTKFSENFLTNVLVSSKHEMVKDTI